MTPRDQAGVLLRKADEDRYVVIRLMDDPRVSDEMVGFHAQQAVEKAIKAVLTAEGVRYRRVHDIAELLDLMRDNNVTYPPELEKATALTPFAADLRYGQLPPEPEPEAAFDRSWARQVVETALDWASEPQRGNT